MDHGVSSSRHVHIRMDADPRKPRYRADAAVGGRVATQRSGVRLEPIRTPSRTVRASADTEHGTEQTMTDERTDGGTTPGGKIRAARLEAGPTQDEMAATPSVPYPAVAGRETTGGMADIPASGDSSHIIRHETVRRGTPVRPMRVCTA